MKLTRAVLLWLIFLIIIPLGFSFVGMCISPNLSLGGDGRGLSHHLMGQKVFVEMNGLYKPMDVEEYVLGVLAGSISPDMEDSVVEAQAVITRTNILKEIEMRGSGEMSDLPFRYVTTEERKENWGKRHVDEYEEKFQRAVVKTAGKVITYHDDLIIGVYHQVSIGQTGSGKEILDEDIPYLQSVESNSDIESKDYMTSKVYSSEELADAFDCEQVKSMEITKSTKHGFVKNVAINGNDYDGTDVVSMLGLPSNNFYIEKNKEGFQITNLGKGNCLGMSQYGANKMASEGYDYQSILQYYYHEVKIEPWKGIVE